MTNLKIKSVTLAFVLLLFTFWAFSCAESDVQGSDLPSDEGFTENADTSLSETITDEEAETMPGDDSYSVELSEVRTNVVERKSRPTEFSAGSSYDEIIYYGGTKESNEEKIKKLPHGVRIMDESCVIENISDLRAELGEASVVDVDDTTMPFDRAVSITVKKVPTTSYEFQITLGESALVGKTEPGNILLVHLYARSVNEGESGRMELIIEKDGTNGDYSKLLKHYVDFGNEWTEIFAPVEFKNGYTSVNLRFGFKLQNIEIGGFEIVDYGNDVRYEDMPVSESGNSSDAAWREEALERIDEVRKGDVKVVVTDSNGNPISGAKTEIEMYEHEFEWGTAVSSGGLSNPKMLDAVGSLFNAAVLENELKWSMYEQNTQRPINMIKKLNELGIYTVRGHCLIWDRNRRTTDTSVPEDLPTLYNDKDKLFDRIESHIFEIMGNMDGYITEWDVLNEACNNTTMQNIYGRELIKEWFAIARDTGIDADLYYNDFKTNDELFALLDKMEQMGVDYSFAGAGCTFA